MKSVATLPCPFCGGNDLDDRGDNAIGCKNLACEAYIDIGHSVGAEARAHVAARWNRRAIRLPDREVLALIRQMHAALKSAVGKWHMESDLGERAEAYLRDHEQ